MVLQMRGTIPQGHKWDVMVDLFFYREPDEAKQQEEEEAVPAGNYAPPPADYGLPAGEWGSTIADTQWPADMAQQPIPAANFYQEQSGFSDEWGASVPAPAPAPLAGAAELGVPAPAATGWDV